MTTSERSRRLGSPRLGFIGYQPTDDAFFDLFAKLRTDRLIPST
jgi:hypothetical protein